MKIVESFWKDVWAACNPEAVDRYVVEDITLTTGGVDIRFPLIRLSSTDRRLN